MIPACQMILVTLIGHCTYTVFRLQFSSVQPLSRVRLFATPWIAACQASLSITNSQISPKHIHFCFIDYAKAFDHVNHNKPWKILQEMGMPDHLTCFLRNLYAGQEATVRTGHGTTDWFQIWKGVHQGCILSPCLFNLYAEYIMRNARLNEAQAGIKIAGEIWIASDMQITPPLWYKAKRK